MWRARERMRTVVRGQRGETDSAGRERGSSIIEFIIAAFVILIAFIVIAQIAIIVNAWQMANYAAFMSARTVITNSEILPVSWSGEHAKVAKNIMAQAYGGSRYEAKAIYYSIPFVSGGVVVYWEMDLFIPKPLSIPFDLMDPDDFFPWLIRKLFPWVPWNPETDNRTMILGYAPLPEEGFFALPGLGQFSLGIPRECEIWGKCGPLEFTDNY
ncbi:MAG: pilus assembly protein [Candidatus Schekmanbacteria bacterium]|nr:pilus assembly protein [Candidatus Schekmanbacteria bacterium]